nr:MAG TPA: hypothetical protein [Caudoviricetes sp.]
MTLLTFTYFLVFLISFLIILDFFYKINIH